MTANQNPPDFKELEHLNGRKQSQRVVIINRTLLSVCVDAKIVIITILVLAVNSFKWTDLAKLTEEQVSTSRLLLLRRMCSVKINKERKADCEVWTDIHVHVLLEQEETAAICKY